MNTLRTVIRLRISGDIRINTLQEVNSINALQGLIRIKTLRKLLGLKVSGHNRINSL